MSCATPDGRRTNNIRTCTVTPVLAERNSICSLATAGDTSPQSSAVSLSPPTISESLENGNSSNVETSYTSSPTLMSGSTRAVRIHIRRNLGRLRGIGRRAPTSTSSSIGTTIFSNARLPASGYHLPSEQVTISLGLRFHSQQGWLSAVLYRARDWTCLDGPGGAHRPAWQEAMWNEESKWPIEISITISVILDTSIAASTCYQLWRSRMMGLKRTRRMIDKLMRWTTHLWIETGALTMLDGVSSVVSLAIVLTKKLDRKGNSYLWLGIALVLPNCYATGLLALNVTLCGRLNARTSLDKLNTDNLSRPTASLIWMRTFSSIEISATRSAMTGGTGDSPTPKVFHL
ncbi:hypothetical protein BD779DRAFT_1790595 [Infundibulicybe gibba]|nr:hypothetical protein BD779DRAFT_1790595 [Infundibulicybe gibba]